MPSRFRDSFKEKFPLLVPVVRAGISARKHRSSRKKIERILRGRREIFVEIGSGEKRGTGSWVTLDLAQNCDIYWDLHKGLPFPDESVQKLYSSHFFEHLSFEQTKVFLQECRRALAPDGNFSICVPNARIYIEAYLDPSFRPPEHFFRYAPGYNNSTRIDYVNYTAYLGGEHKYMFDQENLLYILQSAGFRNVRKRSFDPALDRRDRDFESIYAEAEK